MRVIQKIPARMIGIVVHDKTVSVAIPAPFGGNGPVPRCNLKRTARKPEPVMIAIEAFDVVAVGGTKVFKVAVLERVSENIPPVVRTIVSIPVIVGHVRDVIDATALATVNFGLGVCFPLRWRLGDVPLIAVNAFLMFSAWTLGEGRVCHKQCQSEGNCKTNLHRRGSPKFPVSRCRRESGSGERAPPGPMRATFCAARRVQGFPRAEGMARI